MSRKLVRYRNDFNTVNTSLEVHESRIFYTAIANMRNPSKIDKEGFIQVSAEDMLNIGSNLSNVSREFTSAAESLLNRKFRFMVESEEDGPVERVMNCVAAIDFKPGVRKLGIRFNPLLDDFFQVMQNQYTRFDLLDLKGIRRAPSFNMYSMLMQFKETGIFRISVKDLRYRLIPLTLEEQQQGKKQSEKYRLYGHFKARIIDPAIEEINSAFHTAITVTYKEIKKGRSVESLEFHIKKRAGVDDETDVQEVDGQFELTPQEAMVVEPVVLTDKQATMTAKQIAKYAICLAGLNQNEEEESTFNRDRFFNYVRANDKEYTSKAGSEWGLFRDWLMGRLKDINFVREIYDPWLKELGFKPRQERKKVSS